MANTTASLTVRILADLDSFKKGMTDAESQIVKTGARLASLGEALTIGITAPLIALGATMAKVAADNEASTSKLEHTFGASASAMQGFITNLMKTVPATSEDLRNLTSNTDVFFRSIGLGVPQAVQMTQAITKLAGDLAAFNHVSIDVAQSALQQALAGQTRGLREFGVAITETDVKNRAYALGLARTGDELTHAQLAQAAWSLILDRTKDQQGEAARTINEAANALPRLKQAATEAAGAFGELLVPAAAKVIGKLTEMLKALNDLPTSTKNVVLGIGGIAAAIPVAILVVGSLTEKIVLLSRALTVLGSGSAIAGIAKLVATLGPLGLLAAGALAVIGLDFAQQAEKAAAATAEIERYKAALDKLTTSPGGRSALTQQFTEMQLQLQALERTRGSLNAKIATARTAKQPFDNVLTANVPSGDLAALMDQLKGIDAQTAALRPRFDALVTAIASMNKAAGGGGGEGDSLEQMFKKASERAQNVLAAFDLMKAKFGPIVGFGAELAGALANVEAVLKRIPSAMDPMRIKLEQIAQTIKNDILDALANLSNLSAAGMIPLTNVQAATPGFGPTAIPGPSTITQLGGLEIKAPEVAKIPPELQNVNATLARVKDGLEAGLLGVAQSLQFALAGIAQAFIHGQGSQIGASLLSAGGAAGLTAAVGKFGGAGIGAAFGNAVVPILGGIAGAAIGGLIGGLFDHHKKSVDAANTSMDALSKTVDRVTASITNIPEFFKVQYYRGQAAPIIAVGPVPTTPGAPQYPNPGPPGSPSPSPGGGPIPGAPNGTIIINGNVILPNVQSPADFVRELPEAVLRHRATGSAARLGLAGALG